jgi:hypothetical protein
MNSRSLSASSSFSLMRTARMASAGATFMSLPATRIQSITLSPFPVPITVCQGSSTHRKVGSSGGWLARRSSSIKRSLSWCCWHISSTST